MKPTFYIVDFEDSSVGVVPSNWLLDGQKKCHWPMNTDKIKTVTLAQKCAEPYEYPKVDWGIFNCKVRCGADSYNKADSGVEKAIENSKYVLTETEGEDTTSIRNLRKRTTGLNYEAKSTSDEETSASSQPTPNDSRTSAKDPVATSSSSAHIVQDGNPAFDLTGQVSFPLDPESYLELQNVPQFVFANEAQDQTAAVADTRVTKLIESFDKLSSETRKFQEIVISHLVRISSDVAETIRILSANNQPIFLNENDIPIDLPVNTSEEFRNLGEWLQEENNKLNFVRYLKGIGGADTANFVTRILKRTVGRDLAKSCNFTGTRGKVKFEDHPLFACILAAVRKNSEDTRPSEHEVEKIVSKWLLGASDRNGGRAERYKRSLEKNQNEEGN